MFALGRITILYGFPHKTVNQFADFTSFHKLIAVLPEVRVPTGIPHISMGAVPSAFRLRSLSFFEKSWRFVLVGRSFNCIVPLPVDYILAKMLAVSRISKRMEKQKLLPLLE